MRQTARAAAAAIVATIILAGTEAVVAYPRPSASASLFFRSAFVAYLPIVLALAVVAQRLSPRQGLSLWLPLIAGCLRIATVSDTPRYLLAVAAMAAGLVLARALEKEGRTPPFLFGVTVGLVMPILSSRLAAGRFAADLPRQEAALVIGACGGVAVFIFLRSFVARWPRVAPVFLLGPVVSLLVWSRQDSPRPVPGSAGPDSEARPRADIALIVLDTVRSVPVPVQAGSGLARTMPRLDAFARGATQFPNAWSNASWTLPAHASLFSGLRVSSHRYDSGFSPSARIPSRRFLATRLNDAGYATSAVASNFGVFGREEPLLDGFERVRVEPLRPFAFRPWLFGLIAVIPRAPWMRGVVRAFPGPSVRAPRIVDEALEEWARPGGRPRFLFVNLMEAHLPWIPERDDLGRFGDVGLASEREQVAALGSYLKGSRPSAAEASLLRARYAEALYSLDRSVERLLQGLVAGTRSRELVVIVTSDHGESLGEHDRFGHRNSLDEAATRIPLIVRGPGWVPGLNTAPVELSDVFGIVAAAAGLPLESGLDSQPVGERREVLLEHRPGPQGALPASYPRGDLSALIVWPYKYREGAGEPPALFNLVTDPAETSNLAASDPQMAGLLRDRLRALRGPGSMEKPQLDRATEERLRALGYVR